MQLSNNTSCFIKAVTNPILAEEAALVPDLENADSLCLTDYVELSRPANASVGAARGILVWLRVHESYFYTNLVSGVAGTSNYTYSLCYAWTDANGVMLLNSATSLFTDVQPANIVTIQGGQQINVNDSLVTGLRLFAMGLRILPTVEFVTDTTVNYMVRVIGGQVSNDELYSNYTNAGSIETLLRNSTCAETFANNEGCSVRYNPFQNEQQLRVQSLEDCLDPAQSFGFHKMPAIFIQFSNSTAIAATAPIIIHARFWLHGILKKPSPIYAQQSRADINYPALRTVLSGCHPSLPYVTKGHSFPALTSIAGLALKILNTAGMNYLASQTRTSYVPNRGRRPQRRRQPARGKRFQRPARRGRRNGNGGSRNPYIYPIGTRRQPMMPPNPRNVRGNR